MKFLADGMLGKLTHWLRLLGYDVAYSTESDDNELIALAKNENRILLTRDFELYNRSIASGLKTFYLHVEDAAEQLAILSKRFTFPLKIDFTALRCSKCNTILHSVPKGEVVGKVEKNTLKNYSEFWRCPKCGQIYWQGAHWDRIRTTLRAAEEKLRLC